MKWPVTSKFKQSRRIIGFSLIEVLVGMGIISTVGIVVINAIDTSTKAQDILQERVQANNLITAYLEGIRQLTFSDDPDAYSSVADSVTTPPQYLVNLDIQYSSNAVDWYETSNGTHKLQKITITVLRSSGKQIMSTCTFKTTRIME